jgi:branched-chain amino acid transport system substrate-binding protein
MNRFLFLLLAAASVASAQPASAPIVVGAALPRSGNLADLAADLPKALQLWQEEVNAAGGLLGRKVDLILLDDKSESFAAPGLYQALIGEHRADLLVGPFGSAATLGAAGAAERARRVMVNATGASRVVQRARYRYVFQIPAPLGEYGRVAIEIAHKQGLRRVFILSRDDPQAREMATRASEEAGKLGLLAGSVEGYAPGVNDFAPYIARAQKAGAEAWIAFGLPQDAAEMVKGMRKLAYAPALFLAQGAADPAFIRLLGQDAELALGISPYEVRAATAGNAQFVAAFARRWSAEPGHLAAEGYAAAKVLEEAVRRAGSLEQEKVRAALAALEYGTPLGHYRVDRDGFQVAARPLVLQVLKGRREIVWPEAFASAKWQLPYRK